MNEDIFTEEKNWQVVKNDTLDSWWETKIEAIDRILEIVELGGNGDELDGFSHDGEDDLSLDDIANVLEDTTEEDFYAILDNIKKYIKCKEDIKLYNIADENEIEFLKDDDDDFYYED